MVFDLTVGREQLSFYDVIIKAPAPAQISGYYFHLYYGYSE